MEKTTSKMVEDQFFLMGEALLATTSNKWSNKYKALRTVHQTIKKAKSTIIQKFTAMSAEYSANKKI